MTRSTTRGIAAAALAFVGVNAFVKTEVHAANQRLEHPEAVSAAPPVADHSEASYCTPQFKQVLQRVLNACGLVGQESRRGCQPADVKSFAQIDDADFNALFTPLRERGAIIQYKESEDKLDPEDRKLVEDLWADRKLARYFFVVARASKTGSPDANRALSHKRANSVLFHLQEQTHDPDLDKQVGMLWLGNEFAQLSKDYCTGWKTSNPGEACTEVAVNRSAFVSWVDCRL